MAENGINLSLKAAGESKKDSIAILEKRLKELNCLYAVTELVHTPGLSLTEILTEAAGLIPAAFQYPDKTGVRISINNLDIKTAGYFSSPANLVASIKTTGESSGQLEISTLREGSVNGSLFLEEEMRLIDNIAAQIGKLVELKIIESNLKKSLSQMSAFFEQVNVGLNILDKDFRYLEVNELAARSIGLPAAEIKGKTIHEVVPEFAPLIEPSFKRVIESGEAELNLEVSGPLPGSEEELRWLSAHVPLNLPDGEIGVGVAAVDITTLRQNEEKLRRSEASLQLLTENMLDLVCQIDPDGNFTYASPSHRVILGYDPEELQGRPFFDLIHPADLNEVLLKGSEVSLGRSKARADCRFRHRDGHYIWMELYVSAIAGPEGWVESIMVCSREIGERKQAEKEQEDTLQMYRKALEGIISSMGIAIEKRDPYTSGHQQRVAKLAAAIAREYGLQQEQTDGLRLAAEIHDIGKIAIPAEILNKPGELSSIEFGIIREHPATGYEILKGIEFPWPVAAIVRQHHERLDGSGYPAGLKGEDILLEAKILCVADVVEAMASHRPYRPALGIEEALAEIYKHRGTLFDEEVVDACIRLFNEEKFSLA